jgi:hypothetical protein
MYYSPESKLFRAVNCATNNYGVKSKTTGLAAYPCRACPAGMETSDSLASENTDAGLAYAAFKATNSYTDPKACVTKVGFGYNGRVATQVSSKIAPVRQQHTHADGVSTAPTASSDDKSVWLLHVVLC